MNEQVQRWQVGQVKITSVVEDQTDGIPPELFFPEATADTIRQHSWLVPHFADEEGNIGLRVQALVVETEGRTVVVDPCVGNGRTRSAHFWHDQQWPFMERFVAAGFDPAGVDLVVHTHLHTDHVGWGTHFVEGRWVPTFPQARYLYVRDELERLKASAEPDARAILDDAITPVLDAGLADVVEPDAGLGTGLHLEPTAGHTSAHVSLWVTSVGETALITGDVIHHPVQCAEPGLAFVFDEDAEEARATRWRILRRVADGDQLMLGTHFATLPAGRVTADRDVWRFEPAEPAGLGS